MQSSQEFFDSLKELIEAWCDRRCLSALRYILQGYPLSSSLTDDWAELLEALENVRAFARDELIEKEKQTLNQLISAVNQIVGRNA